MGEDGAVSVSEAALERYTTRMRRARIRYAAVLAVIVVAVSTVTAVVWLSGEISHTTLHTISTPPPALASGPTSAMPSKLWSTTDTPALGQPYYGGTVITHDVHEVRGRNARTGAETWYYKRTDRTVCAALQDNGDTIAIFRLDGNCDEVTALASTTGRRLWTRTLDLNTHQFNGPASFAISGNTVMLVSAGAIYAIDITTGYDLWLFAEQGCTIHRAVLGTAGALISQTCSHRICTGIKFCLDGDQLLLRNATVSDNSDSSTNRGNPDQVIWNLKGDTRVPASADGVISAFSPDGSTLSLLAPANGKTTSTLPLAASNGSLLSASSDTPTSAGDLIWSGGTTYSINSPGASVEWTRVSDTLPTINEPANSVIPPAANAEMTLPTPTGVAVLDQQSGKTTHSYPLTPVPPSTARIYPLGTGFVVAGTQSVTVYS
jgi:hypothetical protein